ncbi:MAG: sigma-70 family RNA polymerase sigma factor [Planctomycetota bacterium]
MTQANPRRSPTPPTPSASPPAPPAPSHPASDEPALVERARTGDRAALGQLLQREQGRIYNVCLRMVGSRADAADAAQEAMLKAVGAIDRFEGTSRFGTWLTRIAINESYTLLRKRQRRSMASLDAPAGHKDDDAPRSDPADTEPGPAQRVQQDEQTALALKALHTLEPDHRAILILRDLQGLDYGEIADALDLKRGTVKSRLFRARMALRAALDAPTTTEHPAPAAASSTEAQP